jgi:hypothetical protein
VSDPPSGGPGPSDLPPTAGGPGPSDLPPAWPAEDKPAGSSATDYSAIQSKSGYQPNKPEEPSKSGIEFPEPEFAILGAEMVKAAAAPTLKFNLGITDRSGLDVYAISLKIGIVIDPVHRQYDDATRARLLELFGEPSRWGATTHSFLWSNTYLLTPQFSGATTVDLPVMGNFDLELAATKYFYSLPDGEVPLTFHFSGSIFYRGVEGRIQVVQVPWRCSSSFKLPVDIWRQMVDYYYPMTGWITLQRETIDLLMEYKSRKGLATFDGCLRTLLANEGLGEPGLYPGLMGG